MQTSEWGMMNLPPTRAARNAQRANTREADEDQHKDICAVSQTLARFHRHLRCFTDICAVSQTFARLHRHLRGFTDICTNTMEFGYVRTLEIHPLFVSPYARKLEVAPPSSTLCTRSQSEIRVQSVEEGQELHVPCKPRSGDECGIAVSNFLNHKC